MMTKINDYFQESEPGSYYAFKDSDGNQLNIGDFIKMSYWITSSDFKYSYGIQSLYHIEFSMKSGIYFNLIGSYRTEFQSEMPEVRSSTVESDEIGFPPDTVIYYRDIDFEDKLIHFDRGYSRFIIKKVNIVEDLFKVHWRYSECNRLIESISREDYLKLRGEDSVEIRENYVLDHRDQVIENINHLY